ncbi:MAG: dehydrogenase [Deltaproteobacteria bacterium]|nr:MAG: dehydrogenase [Deltaproteobacteria bacterium]
MLLKDKIAIITGAAQGIGAAFAEGYTKQGAKIVIADISDIKGTVEAVEQAGSEAIYVKTDITSQESCEAMARTAVEHFGRIDILMNNAAMYANITKKPFTEISADEWNRVMEVNTLGPFNCAKAVFPYMKENGGKIINVSSSSIFEGPTGMPHYVASKGAVFAFTRTMARELGEYDINVNSLAPGYTQSEGSKKIEHNRSTAGVSPEEISIQKRCLKRSALPEDMVGTAIFLGCHLSDFITGQLILCDGGASYN